MERAELDDAVIARAEAHAADFEARWTRSAADRHGTEEVFPTTVARFVRLVAAGRDDQPDARAGFHIDEFEVWTASEAPRNVALASSGAKAQGQSRVAEDFALAYGPELTIDGKFGARWIAAGPELTIALARPERIARVVFSSDRNKSLGREHPDTTFVGDYRIELSLDGENWTEVAQSSDRRPQTSAQRRRRLIDLSATADEKARRAELMAEIDRTDQALAAIEPLPSWWVGVFKEAPGPFAIFQGGDPRKPGESVVAASPSLLDAAVASFRLPAEAPEAQRRLALARWLVGPENPLTPRVLANRLWHYHFGTGIVDTPSDFGFMGGRPTHPELLDWLASEVVATGWRLKPLHRLIVTSQTYQQSSLNRPSASAIDADSRLLWRFPPRRLRAEEIRDAMLAVAGVLESRMEGPGFRLYRYLEDNVATYVPLEEPGPATYRRAVYHHNARAAPVDLLSDFDCPDNAFAAPRRASTISPLQALTLMNNRFTLDMARSLAKRLERNESPEQGDAAIRRAFLLAYSRPPTPQEQGAAADFIRARGLRAFCRAILNSNEFLFLD
jgi:hypothetical protein